MRWSIFSTGWYLHDRNGSGEIWLATKLVSRFPKTRSSSCCANGSDLRIGPVPADGREQRNADQPRAAKSGDDFRTVDQRLARGDAAPVAAAHGADLGGPDNRRDMGLARSGIIRSPVPITSDQ